MRISWPLRQPLPATATRLYRFNGGLQLNGNKSGIDEPIADLPLPEFIVLPLLDYYRQPLAPIVQPGQHVLAGDPVAAGVLASTSGTVVSIEARPVIHPSGLTAECVIISCDGNNATCVSPTAEGQTASINWPASPLTIEQLAACGVTGLGGAGFNTAEKLRSQRDEQLPLLIINGAECEPSIACDQALMAEAADDILRGMQLLADLTHCKRCVIAIEETNTRAVQSIKQALASLADARLSLSCIPAVYPTGAEFPLIKVITGKAVPRGGRPADIGVLCLNVATAHAAYYASQDHALTSRIVTVTGRDASHACNVRVLFGTPISHVLNCTGNQDVLPNSRLRVGGPLSGFDLPHADYPVTAATNCLMLEPSRTPTAAHACIRCAACADVCPMDLLPQQLYWYARAEDAAATERFNLSACIECGCCDLVCPSSIALTDMFRYAKSCQREQVVQERAATLAAQRYQSREQRLAAEKTTRAAELEKRKAVIRARTPLESQDERIADAMQRVKQRRSGKRRT